MLLYHVKCYLDLTRKRQCRAIWRRHEWPQQRTGENRTSLTSSRLAGSTTSSRFSPRTRSSSVSHSKHFNINITYSTQEDREWCNAPGLQILLRPPVSLTFDLLTPEVERFMPLPREPIVPICIRNGSFAFKICVHKFGNAQTTGGKHHGQTGAA